MDSSQKLPFYVYLLLSGQAINLSTAVLSVTVAPLIGLLIAPDPGLATVPYGMQFLAILLSTLPFSRLMTRFGRYAVFLIGVLCLLAAGLTGYAAVSRSSFGLLCAAQFLIGLFISTANSYRFAAADGLRGDLVSRASTMVIAGGVVAAVLAPSLARALQNAAGFVPYSAIYLSLVGFAGVLSVILWLWHRQIRRLGLNQQSAFQTSPQSIRMAPDLRSTMLLGIVAGAGSYFLMNLTMIAASLHLKHHHSFHYASISVQLHVLAMFLPSFGVLRLMSRFSRTKVISAGFWLIALSCLLPLLTAETLAVNAALILLGVGWNFAYSGATALIGSLQGPARIKIQGINETAIAFMASWPRWAHFCPRP